MGFTSIARTQRGSVTPVSTVGRNHLSCVRAASEYGVDRMIRSGCAPNRSASCQRHADRDVRRAGQTHGVEPDGVTLTLTNAFVQQHCECPAAVTSESFARTRRM